MDLLNVGNVATWCASGLALGCIVTFAAAKYEGFTRRRQRGAKTKAIVRFSLPAISESKASASPVFTVRGYDSDELFREDLWLRRIAESRQRIMALQATMPWLKMTVQAREDDKNRVSAMLARHAAARCDN